MSTSMIVGLLFAVALIVVGLWTGGSEQHFTNLVLVYLFPVTILESYRRS